jgi:hypothetical protein
MHTIDPARIGRPLGDEHPLQLDRYDLLRVGGMRTIYLARKRRSTWPDTLKRTTDDRVSHSLNPSS